MDLNQKIKIFLSKVSIQFSEPHFGNSEKFVDIVIVSDASHYINIMISFLKLNNIYFSRPAGPVLQISISDLKLIKDLLSEERKELNVSINESDISEVNRIHFKRKIEKFEVIGKVDAGWRVNINLKDDFNIDWEEIILNKGTYTFSSNKYEFILYFKNEKFMESFINDFCSYSSS
jgi:hypothetical protein